MIPRSLGRVLSCSLLCVFPPAVSAQGAQRADTVVKLAQRPLHPGIATLIEEMSIGVADGSEEYMLGEIADIALGVPPLPEQAAIAAYLDEETAKLDALVGKVEEAVERLQEYRTALITAAVTGKIDVRRYSKATTLTS